MGHSHPSAYSMWTSSYGVLHGESNTGQAPPQTTIQRKLCCAMLTHLASHAPSCNAIITTRCVPSAWRQGVVVHLPKGGDAGDCSNYRPLTLLPVIDKLFA